MARTASAIVVRQANPVRRSGGGSRRFEKLEKRLQAVGRRARDAASNAEEAAITVATPAVFGLMQANGTVLPTVGNFDPYLVIGLPLALGGPKLIGGKWGKRAGAAGIGLLAVAANRAAQQGTFRTAGDEIGGEEIGADDDDD